MSSLNSVLAHPDIKRLVHAFGPENGSPPRPPDAAAREAAVALILRPGQSEELEMLMIRRAEFEGDPWSGNVALPGGHREPGDASLQDAAVRETREEIGVDLARDGKLLGRLDEVRPVSARARRVVVTPFIAVIPPDVHIEPGPEVADTFWVPLALLRQPQLWRETSMTVRGEPRRVVCFHYGEHVVWGMTERILHEFMKRLP